MSNVELEIDTHSTTATFTGQNDSLVVLRRPNINGLLVDEPVGHESVDIADVTGLLLKTIDSIIAIKKNEIDTCKLQPKRSKF